jgi:hypothetical protein
LGAPFSKKTTLQKRMETRRTFIKSTGIILGSATLSNTGMISSNFHKDNQKTVAKRFKSGSREIIYSHSHLKHGDKEKT